MNSIPKLLEGIITKRVGDVEEIITVHLLKEFHEQINQSQLTLLTNVIVTPKIPHKLTFISACTAILKIKLENISDEKDYLEITSSLVALVNSILDFFVSRSSCSTFNAQDRYFSKTVESVATLFIPLRKKFAHFGFVFMKTCSPQILTLTICKRLNFSLRKILAVLYAEEVSHCDLKTFKRITQSHQNLLSELVLWLPLCGDFQLQEALIEIAIYYSASVDTSDKTGLIKKWLANQVYSSAIDSLMFEKFSTSLRSCLNSINSATEPKKIYTLSCLLCVGDNNISINKPKDVDYTDLWVDFNTSSSSIHLIHSPDSAGLDWNRIVLPLSEVKNIEVSPSKCLIKKWPNSAQLHLALKDGLDVVTLGKLYKFTFMIFHFYDDDNFKQLIDEFLSPNFPQLINSKMNNLKKPGSEYLIDTMQNSTGSFNLGAKAYFSQKSSNLSSSDLSKNSSFKFIADNNTLLKKYLNISKENRLKNDKKSNYCDASSDSINYCVGNSLDESNLATSLTRPNSRKFVSVLAHKKKCLKSDISVRKQQDDSWKLNSEPSAFPCKDDGNQSFIRQAGGGKLKHFNTDNNNNNVNLSDKENVEKGLGEILSKSVGNEELDVSIFPDPDSDDDEYLPDDVLRSANISPPIIDEGFPAFLTKNEENKVTKQPLPSLLVDDSNGSDESILGLSRLNFSAVQKLPKQMGEVPLPEYDSDNSSSIIPGSQVKTPPKITDSSKQNDVNKQTNKLIETNICVKADTIAKIGYIEKDKKITKADSVSLSSSPQSIESDDFFVTNKNKSITNFYDKSDVKDIKSNDPPSNRELTSQVPCVNIEKSCFLRADKFLSKFISDTVFNNNVDSASKSYCKELPMTKSSKLSLSENSAFTSVSNLPKESSKNNNNVSSPDVSHSECIVKPDAKKTLKTKESVKLSTSPALMVKKGDSFASNLIANKSKSEDSHNLNKLPLVGKDAQLKESLLKYAPAAFNHKNVDKVSTKSADFGETKFRPISRNEPSPFSFPPRHEPSFRSTDASSKMELELIMNQPVDDLKEKNNFHRTPFKQRHSESFVEKSVKIVKGSSKLNSKSSNEPLESQPTIGEINSRPIVNQVINNCSPEKSSLLVNNTNKTLISSSDSSFLLTPQGSKGSSQNLNFTRIINTDANNNTLEGKKNLKASPSIISVYKPIKTYTRKPAEKLNFKWFNSAEVDKKKSNSINANQPIKKKKLFHLPTNYTESNSELYRDSNPSSYFRRTNQFATSSRNSRGKNMESKKVSTTLFDITELNESSGEEFTLAKKKRNNFKKTKGDGCIYDTLSTKYVRRSTRTQKRVNYKDETEHDTSNESKSDHNSKNTLENQIKNVILNSVGYNNKDFKGSSEKTDFGKNRTDRIIKDDHKDMKKSKNLKLGETNEIKLCIDEEKSGDKHLSSNGCKSYSNTRQNHFGRKMQDKSINSLHSIVKSNEIDAYDFVETSISEKSKNIKKNRAMKKEKDIKKKIMNKNFNKINNLERVKGNNEGSVSRKLAEKTTQEALNNKKADQMSKTIIEPGLNEVTSIEPPTTFESVKDSSVNQHCSSSLVMSKIQVQAVVHHDSNFEPNPSRCITTDMNSIPSETAPTVCSSNSGVLGSEDYNLDKNMLSLLDSVSNTVDTIQDSLNNQKHLLSSLKEIMLTKDIYSQQQS